jgi:hypothetical protein
LLLVKHDDSGSLPRLRAAWITHGQLTSGPATKLSGSFNKVVTEARELLPLLRDFRDRG